MNPKLISVAAGAGFVLSFLIGLFSRVAFPYLVLRALLFALLFAVAAAAISFVFKKFIDVPQGGTDEPSQAAQPATGGVVNITVDDDSLPDDEGSPQFSVGKNRPAFGGGALSSDGGGRAVDDISARAAPAPSAQAPAAAAPAPSSDGQAAAQGFRPMALGTPVASVSVSSDGSIDNLPEIGELNVGSAKGGEVISDSDFASSGTTSISASAGSGGGVAIEGNASLMAQAIRTVLAQEDS